jgi:hypothetical protein
MSRISRCAYHFLPTLMFAGYFACLRYLPQFTKNIIHTERGAIEWGTAAAFLMAACLAALLLWKSRGVAPNRYRVVYAVFCVTGLFVALEEISYGQKFFYWETPAVFRDLNEKQETNLHNMLGSKPSDFMRGLATAGCPVACAILPLWMLAAKRSQQPGTWQHFLLPGPELATMALLTLALTVFNKIPSIKRMATWSGHLGELKELYWGIVAVCYAGIIARRVLTRAPATTNDSTTFDGTHTERRNAA